MADELLFYEDDRARMVAWSTVGICTWFDAPQMTQLRPLRAFTEKLHELNPDGYGFADLIARGVPRFSNEVRVESAAIARDSGKWGLGTAHIILLEGFAGAAVRAFINTMSLMARSNESVRAFATIPEGVDFVRTCMGTRAPERAAFIDILERERVAPPGPPPAQ